MKKIFLSLAVIASVALVSCGGNKADNNADEATVAEIAEVTDSACCGDSVCVDTTVVVAAEVATPGK